MKNIVFVIADLGPGGAQRVMSVLANFLAENPDYRVDVVATSTPREKSFFPYHERVTIHYASVMGASGTLIGGIAANTRRVMVLRSILRGLRPDVVVGFMTEINCITLLAAFGMRIPVVISERSDPYIHPEVKLWRLMRRLTYPLAHTLVCQTQHALSFFSYVRRKLVIPNPVGVVAPDLPAPIEGPYVLGVGRQSVEKGFDLLIEAHAIARRSCPDIKLLLAGDGPERSKLQALVGALGTEDSVTFAGAQKDLSSYYKNATVFVLPSRYEGMPNALLEAMAYGCAVIATPSFGAVSEIIENGQSGLIADKSESGALAESLVRVCQDAALRQRLQQAARASANRYEPRTVLGMWHDLLKMDEASV